MKLTKTLVACSVLAASTGLSSMAVAESPFTGNVGFTSNYIWRGVTQTDDDAAISGGLDYAHDAGFYAGTWVSSLGGGAQYEMDLYAGYGFDAGPVSLDVGYITYIYQVDNTVPAPELDFDEVYINGGWEMLSFGAAYTVSKEASGPDSDLYLYVGADFEIGKGLNLGLVYGDYDFDDPASEDYSHFQVSLSKDDFTFALDKNDSDAVGADDLRFSVSYSKSFDLL